MRVHDIVKIKTRQNPRDWEQGEFEIVKQYVDGSFEIRRTEKLARYEKEELTLIRRYRDRKRSNIERLICGCKIRFHNAPPYNHFTFAKFCKDHSIKR